MGGAKKAQQEHEEKIQYALGIVMKAGAVVECELHPGTYLDGKKDIQGAYMLANANWDEHQAVFKTRREMTDAIKEAYEQNAGEECYSCEKNKAD